MSEIKEEDDYGIKMIVAMEDGYMINQKYHLGLKKIQILIYLSSTEFGMHRSPGSPMQKKTGIKEIKINLRKLQKIL